MTLPRFLVGPGALSGQDVGARVLLDGAEGRHAVTVRRVSVGERIELTDGAGTVARGSVAAVARDRLELAVEALHREPAPTLRFTLAQALAKGGRDELAVECATELGVDAVVPWQAARSVVVWSADRAERGRARWLATVASAAKQSRRAWLPQVELARDTTALVSRIGEAALALVLHEDAEQPLTGVALPGTGEVLLVVGPEGGIDDAELGRLTAAGATAVRLGSSVLRSSTAGAAALAVLSARVGRW